MFTSAVSVCYATFIVFILFLGNAHAELILSAPPRESLEAANELYEPLARHLTKLLGEKVTYKHPENWLHYQRELRNDAYDIVFDGPHFVSWRIKNLQHNVLIKLPGTLEFYVIAKKSSDKITKLKHLIGKKICGISPPNLATMTVIDQFKNPSRQPDILPVRGGFKQVLKDFSAGACDAAIFRTTYYEKKLSEETRARTKILFKSKPLPNQAISVSRRINARDRAKIIQSLTNGDGQKAVLRIVKRFAGKKARSFILTNNGEYLKQSELLEGVVFGW